MKSLFVLLFVGAIWMSQPNGLSGAEIVTIAGTGEDGYAGDGGPALRASLSQPFGIEFGPDGNLYFCDFSNHCVRRIDSATGIITTVAGTGRQSGHGGDGGPATKALFHEPHEARFDRAGNFYVSDTKGHFVRRVDGKTNVITSVAGTGAAGFSGDGGPAAKAELNLPISILLEADGSVLICDIKNNRIRKIDPTSALISTIGGNGEGKPVIDGAKLLETPIHGPRSLAVDPNQDLILILREGNSVYRINKKTQTLHHIAGTGKQGYSGDGGDARQALFGGPKGVAVDKQGNILICDTENHVIRIIDPATGKIDTLIGNGRAGDGPDGDLRRCQLNRPHGIFVNSDGAIYIGDSGNHKIRKVVR